MKIATWNVNSIRARLPLLEHFLEKEAPDILALQETKVLNAGFPIDEMKKLGYHVLCKGELSYNGVAILSRQPLTEISHQLSGAPDDASHYLCAGDHHGGAILSLYVPNGYMIGSDKFSYKLAWLEALINDLETLHARYSPLWVMGDFNIAPCDIDVHDPKTWEGKILVSPEERQLFARILDLGYKDIYREFHPNKKAYTWWDYRTYAYKKGDKGLRIDHILCSKEAFQNCNSIEILREYGGMMRPSDHAPVVLTCH